MRDNSGMSENILYHAILDIMLSIVADVDVRLLVIIVFLSH